MITISKYWMLKKWKKGDQPMNIKHLINFTSNIWENGNQLEYGHAITSTCQGRTCHH